MKLIWAVLLVGLAAGAQALPVVSEVADLKVQTLDGAERPLKELLNGKPVYFKFWATWCRSCMEQMPHFQAVQQTYGERVQVIGVNLGINDDLAAIAHVKKQHALTMPLVMDNSGALAKAFEVVATPYSLLLDNKGQLVHAGYETSGALDNLLAFLAKHQTFTAQTEAQHNPATEGRLAVEAKDKPTALFFFATFCDWYFAEHRPAMSQNCVDGQKMANALAQKHPNYRWVGIASRMWTGDKELQEYRDKYQVPFELHIDSSNETFLAYQVTKVPTLVLVNSGDQAVRVESFEDEKAVEALLNGH